jgi:tripartite-type tricarboxylate transporter receptor subunit TctC
LSHGADDPLGRPIFEHAAKQIGQSLVFEHRPGTGGTLGMAQVAKAAEAGPIAV